MTRHVWWSVLGGGWIHGPLDTETGEVTGDEVMYIYPDMEHVLYGTFKRGAMVRAEQTTVADIGELNALFLLVSSRNALFLLDIRGIFIALVLLLLALKIT